MAETVPTTDIQNPPTYTDILLKMLIEEQRTLIAVQIEIRTLLEAM